MTKAELKKIVDKHTTCASDYEAIWRAVEAYSSASNNGKPIVMGCRVWTNEDEDFEEREFEMCSRCDGHPACVDFGCAYEHGLGHLVRTEPGGEDW